jgi:hypothetical protein
VPENYGERPRADRLVRIQAKVEETAQRIRLAAFDGRFQQAFAVQFLLRKLLQIIPAD